MKTQLSVHKPYSNGIYLHGSNHKQYGYISIQLEDNRRRIVTIELTEKQWLAFISGTPTISTVSNLLGERFTVPVPTPDNTFKNRLRGNLEAAHKHLATLLQDINDLKVPQKTKDALRSKLIQTRNSIDTDHVVDMFAEHIEEQNA